MKCNVHQNTDILEALSELAPGSSKTKRRKWLEDRRIFINGALITKNDLVQPGDEIYLAPKQKIVHGLHVYYKDTHVIAVEKPEGLLSVATDREPHCLHKILKKKFPLVWPVQRLDRETSGIIVFALSHEAKEGLKKQFAAHSVTREYYAVVEGVLQKKSGTLRDRLSDGKDYIVRPSAKGVVAITHYQVVQKTKDRSHLLLRLKTGKKNQIRVQMNLIGHPVLGDEKYGASKGLAKRLHLHAQRLEFIHPISGKKLAFFSPKPFR